MIWSSENIADYDGEELLVQVKDGKHFLYYIGTFREDALDVDFANFPIPVNKIVNFVPTDSFS